MNSFPITLLPKSMADIARTYCEKYSWNDKDNDSTILNTTFTLSFLFFRAFNFSLKSPLENFNYLGNLTASMIVSYYSAKFINNLLLNEDFKKNFDAEKNLPRLKKVNRNLTSLAEIYFGVSKKEHAAVNSEDGRKTPFKDRSLQEHENILQRIEDKQNVFKTIGFINSFTSELEKDKQTIDKRIKYPYCNKLINAINYSSIIPSQLIAFCGLFAKNHFVTKLFLAKILLYTMETSNFTTDFLYTIFICVGAADFALNTFLNSSIRQVVNQWLYKAPPSLQKQTVVALSDQIDSQDKNYCFNNASNEKTAVINSLYSPVASSIPHTQCPPCPPCLTNKPPFNLEMQCLPCTAPAITETQCFTQFPHLTDSTATPSIFSTISSYFTWPVLCRITAIAMLGYAIFRTYREKSQGNVQKQTLNKPQEPTIVMKKTEENAQQHTIATPITKKLQKSIDTSNDEDAKQQTAVISVPVTQEVQKCIDTSPKEKNEKQQISFIPVQQVVQENHTHRNENHSARESFYNTERYFITRYAISTVKFGKAFIFNITRCVGYIAVSTFCIFGIVFERGRSFLKFTTVAIFTNFTDAVISFIGIASPYLGSALIKT